MKNIIFIGLLYLLPNLLFAQNSAEDMCMHLVQQNKIQHKSVKKHCSKAGDAYLKRKNYDSASWYYLLSGAHQEIITMQKKVSQKTEISLMLKTTIDF